MQSRWSRGGIIISSLSHLSSSATPLIIYRSSPIAHSPIWGFSLLPIALSPISLRLAPLAYRSSSITHSPIWGFSLLPIAPYLSSPPLRSITYRSLAYLLPSPRPSLPIAPHLSLIHLSGALACYLSLFHLSSPPLRPPPSPIAPYLSLTHLSGALACYLSLPYLSLLTYRSLTHLGLQPVIYRSLAYLCRASFAVNLALVVKRPVGILGKRDCVAASFLAPSCATG